jgi:hypothetical protein
MQLIQKNEVPCLFVVSSNTNLVALNNSQECIGIRPGGSSANEVQAVLNKDFNHFTIEENIGDALSNYPPLLVPFADFKINGDVQVLATQKIGSAKTSYPLIVLGSKQGIILGEGIWRWAMQDKRPENQFGNAFTDLINRMSLYLERHANKMPFEASPSKKLFSAEEMKVENISTPLT